MQGDRKEMETPDIIHDVVITAWIERDNWNDEASDENCNDDDNFEEGAIDIFTGNDLKECNNFELGNVVSPDQFSK